ncbi:MAG: ribonuclease III domain-containing protein [Myxococcota bacterium]
MLSDWIEERYPGGQAVHHANECQQRLEFLGDAFLGWVVGRWCFETLPSAQESALTDARKAYIDRAWLQQRGASFGIEPHVRRGIGETKKAATNAALLEDTMEAILGAIVVDAGEATAAAVLRAWLPTEPDRIAAKDPISALNEWHMARCKAAMPEGRSESSGEDHARGTYTVEVDGIVAVGHGATKQVAQRDACAQILVRIAGG